MYELLLIACIGARFCEYHAIPVTYPTSEKCMTQAALIAGTVRGHHEPGLELRYKADCHRVESARYRLASAIPPPPDAE